MKYCNNMVYLYNTVEKGGRVLRTERGGEGGGRGWRGRGKWGGRGKGEGGGLGAGLGQPR